MSDDFDPYLRWLGIQTGGRKVNHYRLLGLELFETDSELIGAAANRLIKHVESFIGEHPAECQKLGNELTAARNCLLSVERKQVYDRKLRAAIKAKKAKSKRPEKQASGGGAETTAKARPVAPPAKPVRQSSLAPNFSGIEAEPDPAPGGQSSAPRIKSGKIRKKKKGGAFYEIAGWVLGGVGAVVFAWVLLNTDLIDRIRGRETVAVENETQDPVKPVELETQEIQEKPQRTEPKVKPPEDPSVSMPEEKPIQPALPSNDLELPTTTVTKPSRAPIKRQPVPDADLLKQAMDDVADQFKNAFASNDKNIKGASSRSIFLNVDEEAKPERRYAKLVAVAKLAAEANEVELIVDAIKKLKRQFEGSDFWSDIEKPVGRSIDYKKPLEFVKRDVEMLLTTAQTDERWQLCGRLAGDAADFAKKSGDSLQHDLLKRYAKDIRGLVTLKKKYEPLASRGDEKFTSKESLEFGKYLCFGKRNWKRGLACLSNGNDSALAAVAKLDLDSINDSDSNFSTAEAWAKLSRKSKYKGADRRFMLGRALVLLDDANVSISDRQEAVDAIQQQIALFKNYVSISALMSKSVEFDVQGWATFDRAMLERGRILKLGLNANIRNIHLRDSKDSLVGTTVDRQVRFEIRALQYGAVEMKVFESGTNLLRNVLYGK